jgi:hypothetical protein
VVVLLLDSLALFQFSHALLRSEPPIAGLYSSCRPDLVLPAAGAPVLDFLLHVFSCRQSHDLVELG